jgi:DNA-binding transcriptional MocR family regulator
MRLAYCYPDEGDVAEGVRRIGDVLAEAEMAHRS